MPFSIHADGEHIKVTTRPKRWNLVLQVLSIAWWSFVAVGLSRLLATYGWLPMWGWIVLAASPVLAVIAVAGIVWREVVQVSSEEARGHVDVFGLRVRRRTASVGVRRFYVPPRPKFLSWGDSAPWVRLTDSTFKFGHDELTREQAHEVAATLNNFLDAAAPAASPAGGPA